MIKFICLSFWALLQTQMTDLPSLLYTSTSEIPTLSQTWSLKKVPLPGRSLPVQAIIGSNPNPPPPGLLLVIAAFIGQARIEYCGKGLIDFEEKPKTQERFWQRRSRAIRKSCKSLKTTVTLFKYPGKSFIQSTPVVKTSPSSLISTAWGPRQEGLKPFRNYRKILPQASITRKETDGISKQTSQYAACQASCGWRG